MTSIAIPAVPVASNESSRLQQFVIRLTTMLLVGDLLAFIGVLLLAPNMSLQSRELAIGIMLAVAYPALVIWTSLLLLRKGQRLAFWSLMAAVLLTVYVVFEPIFRFLAS